MAERVETPEQYQARMKVLGQDKTKLQIDLQAVERLFPTKASRRIFEQIDAATGGHESAIKHKQQTILEIRNKKLPDQAILDGNPVVYVGSGIDWEYPVCLGGREIILVDPILGNENSIRQLKERIKGATGSEPTTKDGGLQFLVDFGTGDEKISIKLEPALYCSPEFQERLKINGEDKLSRFQPPEKIGMLLGFQFTGTDVEIDDDTETMSNVITGGFVLANNALGNFFHRVTMEEQGQYLLSSPEEKLTVKRNWWKEKGLDLIPLETVPDTFLRKS